MNENLKMYEEKMDKSISFFQTDIGTLRVGRANPAVLDKIKVEYYGVPTPLAQVGTIAVPEPQTITIQPWDSSILGDIEKAINKSDIGINPQNDGKIIRINFPPLTEERRKEIAKSLSKKSEEAKVNIRNIRREAMDLLKKELKNKTMTEDEVKAAEDDAQKLTDKKIAEIDAITAKKEKEILEV